MTDEELSERAGVRDDMQSCIIHLVIFLVAIAEAVVILVLL